MRQPSAVNPIWNQGALALALLLVVGLVAACGGGDTATTQAETEAAAETAQDTAAAATTQEEAAPDTAAFDAAAAQVVEKTNALIALRAECFAKPVPEGTIDTTAIMQCLVSDENEAAYAAGVKELEAALATAGAEATAAGAAPDACEGLLGAVAPKLSGEQTALLQHYGIVDGELQVGGFDTTVINAWTYYDQMVSNFGSDPGFMVGLALGDCRLAVAGGAENAPLLNAALAYTFGMMRTRNALGYGTWGLSFCLFAAKERTPCVSSMNGPADLTESIGKMEAGFAELTAAPGYAELSSTCKSGFEQANATLVEQGRALEGYYTEALAIPPSASGLDKEVSDLWAKATKDAESAKPEASPIDEETIFSCLDEVAAQGG